MLTRLTILKAGLVIWIVWHAGFAYLATFAPELGATIVGWSTPDVWGDELRAMSKQYGMVMFLLAGVYLIMLIDPLRYLSLIWIAVGEQLLGIAYGVYIFAFLGQLTEFQLTIQFLTNAVLIVGMVVLWLGLRRQPNRAESRVRDRPYGLPTAPQVFAAKRAKAFLRVQESALANTRIRLSHSP